MAIGRALRTLAIYDLFTNLIPGIVLTSTILLLIPFESKTKTIPAGILVATFISLSFALGHLAQFVGSKREGTPTTFGDSVKAINARCPDWAPIRVTHIESSFLDKCKKEFDLPNEFNDYGRLLQLLLSHLETTSHTRALRFQAVHAFHRSMWAISELLIGISFSMVLFDVFELWSSRSSGIAIAVLGLSMVGRYVFNVRRKKFDKKFVEYVIVDFYEDTVS